GRGRARPGARSRSGARRRPGLVHPVRGLGGDGTSPAEGRVRARARRDPRASARGTGTRPPIDRGFPDPSARGIIHRDLARGLDPRIVGPLLVLVAHDLRNPLSALHSNVGFLESATEPEDQDIREALSDITVSCSSLNQIIDNLELLGIANLDEPPKLDRLPLRIEELARECIARAESSAASYGTELQLLPTSGTGAHVLVHREMAGRALGNL